MANHKRIDLGQHVLVVRVAPLRVSSLYHLVGILHRQAEKLTDSCVEKGLVVPRLIGDSFTGFSQQRVRSFKSIDGGCRTVVLVAHLIPLGVSVVFNVYSLHANSCRYVPTKHCAKIVENFAINTAVKGTTVGSPMYDSPLAWRVVPNTRKRALSGTGS